MSGSRVQRVVDRPGRRPALPRQPRHTYAAVLRCGLPTGLAHPASELIPPEAGSRTAHRPISARFEPAPDLRGVHHWFARTTPSDLARRARTVWQSQHDPALSGLLPPAPASPGPGFPQLQSGRCDGPMVKASHLHTTTRRFTAHGEHQVHKSKGHVGRSCWAACEPCLRGWLAAKALIRGRDTVLGTHRSGAPPNPGGVWGWCGGARRPHGAAPATRRPWWPSFVPAARAASEPAGRSGITACATRRGCSDGGERPSLLCRRGGGVKLAAADPGIAGVGGSSRDKVGSVQDCRMGRAR